MDAHRKDELRRLAEREVRYNGIRRDWRTIQDDYPIYEMTEADTRYMVDLIWHATIVLPED